MKYILVLFILIANHLCGQDTKLMLQNGQFNSSDYSYDTKNPIYYINIENDDYFITNDYEKNALSIWESKTGKLIEIFYLPKEQNLISLKFPQTINQITYQTYHPAKGNIISVLNTRTRNTEILIESFGSIYSSNTSNKIYIHNPENSQEYNYGPDRSEKKVYDIKKKTVEIIENFPDSLLEAIKGNIFYQTKTKIAENKEMYFIISKSNIDTIYEISKKLTDSLLRGSPRKQVSANGKYLIGYGLYNGFYSYGIVDLETKKIVTDDQIRKKLFQTDFNYKEYNYITNDPNKSKQGANATIFDETNQKIISEIFVNQNTFGNIESDKNSENIAFYAFTFYHDKKLEEAFADIGLRNFNLRTMQLNSYLPDRNYSYCNPSNPFKYTSDSLITFLHQYSMSDDSITMTNWNFKKNIFKLTPIRFDYQSDNLSNYKKFLELETGFDYIYIKDQNTFGLIGFDWADYFDVSSFEIKNKSYEIENDNYYDSNSNRSRFDFENNLYSLISEAKFDTYRSEISIFDISKKKKKLIHHLFVNNDITSIKDISTFKNKNFLSLVWKDGIEILNFEKGNSIREMGSDFQKYSGNTTSIIKGELLICANKLSLKEFNLISGKHQYSYNLSCDKPIKNIWKATKLFDINDSLFAYNHDSNIEIWNVKTKKAVFTFNIEKITEVQPLENLHYDFYNDKLILQISSDILLYSIKNKKYITTITNANLLPNSGNIVQNQNGKIVILNSNNKILKAPQILDSNITWMLPSNNPNFLYVVSRDFGASIIDLENDSIYEKNVLYSDEKEKLNSLWIGKNGETILSTWGNLRINDIKNKRSIDFDREFGYESYDVCFFDDYSNQIHINQNDAQSKIFNISNWAFDSAYDSRQARSCYFNSDFQIEDQGSFIQIRNKKTKFKFVVQEQRNSILQTAFSKDEKVIFASYSDGSIKAFEIASGKLKMELLNPGIQIKDFTLFEDQKLLAISSNNGIIIWDLIKETPLITLYPFNNNEYLIRCPDNYFMSTVKNLNDKIHYVQNFKSYPFEQFDLKYNRPDIVISRIGKSDSSMINSYKNAYFKRLKRMNFTEEMLKDDFHLPEIKIKNFEYLPTLTDSSDLNLDLDIKDSKYKLDRINIFINDVPVFGTAGIDLRKENIQELNKKITFSLSEGKNKIQVSVLNQAGAESYKETAYVTYKPKKSIQPDLYLVTIGDSKYSDSRYDLTYASKDATDIKNAFEKNSNSLYGAVHAFNYTDTQVTKENILKLKSELLKAKRDDVVLITVADHGVLDKNLDYYLATHDMDFSNPSEKGLPYEDLESLLDGIAPLKKVLFLDACHSGEVDKEEVELLATNTTTNSKVKFRNAGAGIQKKNLGLKTTSELMSELFTDLRRGTGATVISSAGGAEYAMESDEWKNGLFTYCLLHGLQDKAADENKDGEIWLSELQNYLRKEVTSLSNGAQQPTSRIENLSMDFRVW
jgi:hypothetical protein